MKMSDVLSQDEIKYRGWLQIALKDTEDNEKWNAVQEAVRGHDKLVELNKELVEAFTDVLTHADFDVYSSEEIQAFERLRIKAKELTND